MVLSIKNSNSLHNKRKHESNKNTMFKLQLEQAPQCNDRRAWERTDRCCFEFVDAYRMARNIYVGKLTCMLWFGKSYAYRAARAHRILLPASVSSCLWHLCTRTSGHMEMVGPHLVCRSLQFTY